MNLKPFALIFLLSAAIPAVAQTTMSPTVQQRIDQREANQQKRIGHGEKSGALTQREVGRLEKGQAWVEKMEQTAAADGTLTSREARRIEHAQNVQSRHIRHEKHDRQHDVNHDGKRDRPHRGS